MTDAPRPETDTGREPSRGPNVVASMIHDATTQMGEACRSGWRVLRQKGPSQFQFWLIALLIGIAAGFAALFFRKGINALPTKAAKANPNA